MLAKFVIIVMLLAIIWNLGAALLHMFRRREGEETRMARALTWRILLSLLLFGLLMLGVFTGVLRPHGIAG